MELVILVGVIKAFVGIVLTGADIISSRALQSDMQGAGIPHSAKSSGNVIVLRPLFPEYS